MSNPIQKSAKILSGVAAVAAMVEATYNTEKGEYEKVTLAGIPVWYRDAQGYPKLLGIPFGRWIRGPRR